MSTPPVERVLDALRQRGHEPRRTGAGWECACPAHDDRRPSLSVSEGDDGRALVHCHAGCAPEEVVAALGLTLRELMIDDAATATGARPNGRDRRGPTSTQRPARADRVYPTAAAAVAELERRCGGARSGMWTYRSAAGDPVGVVVRFDRADGKHYRPASRTASGWTLRGMPAPRPLYRLPHLDGETRIYVVEGEKCAEAAAGIDLVATTSLHGAKSPTKTDWSPLAGLEVIVIPDHDAAGEGYAREVAGILMGLSPPAEVRVLRLPGLSPGGDIDDFIAARKAAGLTDEAIRREVEALAAAAPTPSVGSVGATGEGDAGCSWPEPKPLPDPLPPVLAFDPDLLPGALRPWVVDIAERIQCPIDFPAVAAMVALSAIVGRKLGIRPKRHDDWTVVPNLWGGVIGRPGVMKTPALQEPLKPLKALEIRAKEQFDALSREREADKRVAEARRKTAEGEIRKAVKKDRAEARRIAMESMEDEGDGPEPTRRRYLVNDSSVEKLGEILNENPSGVLVYRDELIGLLKGLEKEGQESARSFYLEAWNGTGRYTYDRIGRGTIDIDAAVVSIIGGIQPGPLLQYLRTAVKEGSGDDGLMQRFQLLVWPDLSPNWVNVDRWPDSAARQTAHELFEGLDGLEPDLLGADPDPYEPGGIPFFRFSHQAQEVFDRWRAGLEATVRSGELHPVLESHFAKFRSLIPSLALLIHLADVGRGPVGSEALQRAIRWGEYLQSHARRIYAHAAHPDLAAARALAKKLAGGDLADEFALRDVYRAGWSGLTTPEDAKGAVDLLVDLDWLREERRATGGRTATVHLINPGVFTHTPVGGTDRTDGRGAGGASGGSVGAHPGGGPELHGPDDDADGGAEVPS